MIIYVDVVFIENFILNYLILIASSLVGNKKICFLKFVAASFIGSLYTISAYCVDNFVFFEIMTKIVVSIVMMKVAYELENMKCLIKQLLIFYIVSLTFGGAVFMFLFTADKYLRIINGQLFCSKTLSICILAVLVIFGGFLCFSSILKSIYNRKICDIEIFLGEKSKKVRLLIDSGNLLKDPITGYSVVIIQKKNVKELISNKLYENITNISKGRYLGESEFEEKIFILPFKALGNENGILVGFKPSYIKLYKEDIKCVYNVIIGIYDGKLTTTNIYEGLIGSEILEGSRKNEKFSSKV